VRLYVGKEQAQAPQYDLASIFARTNPPAVTSATFGPLENNPKESLSDNGTPTAWSERNRAFLMVVLGIVAVGLGLWTFRLLRKTVPPNS
jgi:hypothetical protein